VKTHARRFYFGEFELDDSRIELRRGSELIELHATPFRLLVFLLENRAHVVSKAAVLEEVWPGVAVSDTALSTALKQIRQALGDDGAQQRWVRTLRGRGYQFVGEVRVESSVQPESAPTGGLYGVPRGLSMSFVGRAAELSELEEVLTKQTYVSIQASVEGLAGIGKTELALQLAYRLAHTGQFPGGIFWLDAEQCDLRVAWGSGIADRLEVAGGSLDERCKAVIRRLSEQRDLTLVILDNVGGWSPRSLPSPLPEGPHIRLLVTTRERSLGGPQFLHIDLGFLASPQDREVLERIAGRSLGPGAESLLSHLGGHALGLELAGAFLALYPGESAEDYLEALQRDPEATEHEASGRVRYERTVSDALRTIASRLDPRTRDAWLTAACFAPEPVSFELSEAAGVEAGSRRALERFHLIRPTAGGRWVMHRLVRAFGQRMGTEEERREARRRFVSGCLNRASSGLSDVDPYALDSAHYDIAIRMAGELLDSESELRLLAGVAWAFLMRNGYTTDEVADVFARARRLAASAGAQDTQPWVLEGTWTHLVAGARWQSGNEIAASMLQRPSEQDSPVARITAHTLTGIGLLYTGEIVRADREMDLAIRLYRDAGPVVFPSSVALLSQSGFAKLLLGLPDRALALSEEAVRIVRPDPLVLCLKALLQVARGDLVDLEGSARSALDIAVENQQAVYQRVARILIAWASVASGRCDPKIGLEVIREQRAELNKLGFAMMRVCWISLAARICASIGAFAEGRALAREALDHIEASGERIMEAEIWRCLAGVTEDLDERRAHLERSIAVAEGQSALWWALRSSCDLAEAAGDPASRARLAAVCGRFTEGFELADLQRAKALLVRP
jgi:DNA-binding winged helix-turn-helix (wHTH) protein